MVNEWMEFISKYDPEVGGAIEKECGRQRRNLELIASENIVSEPVMAAMGTVLTNKYAEGYPGKRYYGGCECVDVVENIAIERAKKIFGAGYANVQPHSGAQANMAVQFAMLKPGDTDISPTVPLSTCRASITILCRTVWMRKPVISTMTRYSRSRKSASPS